jgi:Beta protein
MSFPHRHYVPCLRWKQGEYKALGTLSNVAAELITPLIEVPEKGYDFETKTYRKSIDDHLAPIAKRVKANWRQRSCFVDLDLIPPNDRIRGAVHPVTYVFEQLNVRGCSAIPITGLDRETQYQHAIGRAVSKDKRGLCLRIRLEQATQSNLKTSIQSLLQRLPVEDCDLILDLGAPNFVPLEGFAQLVESIIGKLPDLEKWRTFTLIGTSFPSTIAELPSGQSIIPRNEWLLYKLLAPRLHKAGIRIPTFGDYVINHPEVSQMDMRLVKPSATIRYSIDDAWFIVKGPNVRDHRFGQYVDHCKTVISSSHYMGAAFSKADAYISGCAAGNASTGNLSTWRWIGTNHHLEKVARDVASFFDSLGTV